MAALGLVVEPPAVPPGARSAGPDGLAMAQGTVPAAPSVPPGRATGRATGVPADPSPGTPAAGARGTAPGAVAGGPEVPAPVRGTMPGAPADGTPVLGTPARTAPVRLASAPASEVVVVLAADMPFLDSGTVRALVDRLGQGAPGGGQGGATEPEGVVLTDPGGRDQPLAAAYRTEPLRRELALLRAEHGGLGGLPLRMLIAELALTRVPDPTGDASFDCDTWDDVAAARARLDPRSPR